LVSIPALGKDGLHRNRLLFKRLHNVEVNTVPNCLKSGVSRAAWGVQSSVATEVD
jgi:hypothetical protein